MAKFTPDDAAEMNSNGHSLRRTSPKGGPFIGTCTKCGMENLPVDQVGKPCTNPANLTQDEALMIAIQGEQNEA